MGHRADFVVIRDGSASAYTDNWAALGCVHMITDGPEAAVEAVAEFEVSTELLDWAFAEGGYLVDFDEKLLIVFGTVDDEAEEYLELEEMEDEPDDVLEEKGREILLNQFKALFETSSRHWRGWRLRWDDRGVDAFAEHLASRGISNIKTQPFSHPAEVGKYETIVPGQMSN